MPWVPMLIAEGDTLSEEKYQGQKQEAAVTKEIGTKEQRQGR